MRRNARIITFLCAAVLLLSAAAAVGAVRSVKYRRELENGYMRAVGGLTEDVTEIDIRLHKCICSGSSESFASAAERIRSCTLQGKIHAAELPVGAEWDGVERFLTETGEYVCSLEDKEELTQQDYDKLISLSESAQELRLLLEDITEMCRDKGSWHEEWDDLAFHSGNLTLLSDASAISEAGESFHPAGDTVSPQEPALLSGSDAVTARQAQAAAEKAAGVRLYCSGESFGAAEAYIFTSTDRKTEAAVTKRRGTVAYVIKDVSVSETRLTAEDARKKAEIYLRSLGIGDVSMTGCSIYDGICEMTFAPTQDGIVLYPDAVRVSVTLDRGEIAAYNASDYIMNHKERTLAAKVTCTQAQEAMSDMLSVEDSRLALIRPQGKRETLCYEFICKRWDGGEAAVYINANDMTEEQILLISRTEDGMLCDHYE